MELVVREFSLATALSDIGTIVTALADQKRMRIDFDVDPSLPPIVADPGKFKQIMYNLLSNAIKFTAEGGRVSVAARRTAGAGDLVEIAVSDTGVGISPEDQKRIFEEFEQVTTDQNQREQGTGLGLALTKRLVELHGGRVWVESARGLGSTFRVTLPLRAKHVANVPLPRAAVELREPAPSERPVVLVVEDDEHAGELLSHYLREAGYGVARARTGDEDLALATKLVPHAITLDILLPGLNGHDVLAQLKASPATANIPVIVVSMTEDRELGLSLGAVDWLLKPTRREDFIAAVRRAAGAAAHAGRASVLVVDDERSAIEFLTDMLTNHGFDVTGALGGREAVTIALETPPDVIVLDLIMPGVSGFDVVRELRAHPGGRVIPIIVFTAKDLTGEERAGLEDTVQAIVLKGSGRDALIAALAKITPRSNVNV